MERTMDTLELHDFGKGQVEASIERTLKIESGTKGALELQAILKKNKWTLKQFCNFLWKSRG